MIEKAQLTNISMKKDEWDIEIDFSIDNDDYRLIITDKFKTKLIYHKETYTCSHCKEKHLICKYLNDYRELILKKLKEESTLRLELLYL
jgi:hypothetical protein